MELTSYHQPEEFQKGQKETPHVQPPPRILLSGIHLSWTRRAPPGRTLSQNDWLETTRKLIPSPWNPRLQAMWQSCSPGFPSPTVLPPGCPFPIKALAMSAHVSPQTIHFWLLDKSPVSGPGRDSPFLQHNQKTDFLKWIDCMSQKQPLCFLRNLEAAMFAIVLDDSQLMIPSFPLRPEEEEVLLYFLMILSFSVRGIFQTRVLEWVAISFSRESPWPRDLTQVSCIAGRRFTFWATRERLYDTEKHKNYMSPQRNISHHCMEVICTCNVCSASNISYKHCIIYFS